MPAPILKLVYDDFLERVDGSIHSGHLVSSVEDVTQVPWLGVQAPPISDGIDNDEVSKLLIDYLMADWDQPHQGADQQCLGISVLRSALMTSRAAHRISCGCWFCALRFSASSSTRAFPEGFSCILTCDPRRPVVQSRCKQDAVT